jgi:serine-type D-Ala-D-Ala carboxypeptidase (penicillin-binding protein 5/6)
MPISATPVTRRHFLEASGLGLLGLSWTQAGWAQTPTERPLPSRAAADRLDGAPLVTAKGWAIVDGAKGRLLWGGNEKAQLVMASTTKIMTAHLVLRLAAENAKVLDETMTVSEQAAKTSGSSARIRAGDRLSVRNLLYGLLLPSGNDAAVVFAEHFGQRYRDAKDPTPPLAAFVAAMNRQAGTMRLEATRYFDPHGLGKNHTSAHDLATLAFNAMQNQLFRDYVRTRRHRCEIADAKGTRRTVEWNNSNKLLDIEGFDGIKTGTTTAAGSCLVASGRRGTDHLIVVALGCTSNDSRYLDTRNLFRWAWRQRGHKD